MIVNPAHPTRLLAVVAHPDDLEFTSGGTIALWTSNGCEATVCVCTHGEKGTKNREVDPHVLARVREEEQREAARVLGVDTVVLLDYPDGGLTPTLKLRLDLVRLIRRVRPSAVVCPDPTQRFDATSVNHPDHIAVGEATLQAVYPTARDEAAAREVLAEGYEPHAVQDVFLYSPREANCVVDITTTLETKVAAVAAHRSQVDERAAHEYVARRAKLVGARHGVAHAESFYAISID